MSKLTVGSEKSSENMIRLKLGFQSKNGIWKLFCVCIGKLDKMRCLGWKEREDRLCAKCCSSAVVNQMVDCMPDSRSTFVKLFAQLFECMPGSTLRASNQGVPPSKEDIGSVPQCTKLLCYSGSTSHNAQCFYDDQDQYSQFSPHCRIHVHSSIILKDTIWIAEFSWFSSLFGIFKALLSLDNLTVSEKSNCNE